MKHQWKEFDLSAAASGIESCAVCGLIKNSKNGSSPCCGAAGLRPFYAAKKSAVEHGQNHCDDESWCCEARKGVCSGQNCINFTPVS